MDIVKQAKKLLCGGVFAMFAFNLTALAAPVLWVNDTGGNIGTVDVATGTVTVIGNTHQTLVDIAFDPDGNLYGITFTQLFQINKTTAAATLVGNLEA